MWSLLDNSNVFNYYCKNKKKTCPNPHALQCNQIEFLWGTADAAFNPKTYPAVFSLVSAFLDLNVFYKIILHSKQNIKHIFSIFTPHLYLLGDLSVQFFNCPSSLGRAHFEQLQRYFISCSHFSHSPLKTCLPKTWTAAVCKIQAMTPAVHVFLPCLTCVWLYTGGIIFGLQVLDSTHSPFLPHEFAQDLEYDIQFQ